MAQNLTLGRGELSLAQFKPNSRTPDGFRYFGNTPEFSMNIESEELDHYSSDHGIREKDDSIPLEVSRSGSFITDDISSENVALFFFGAASLITQASVASSLETFSDINANRQYLLGVTAANPSGYSGIDSAGFSVETDGSVALVVDVDYTIDFVNGVIRFLEDSLVAVDGTNIEVTYAVEALTRDRVISGSTPIEGSLMFISDNPQGDDFKFLMPYVKITPAGDYNLKGDDWQQIPYNIEILKNGTQEAIIRDGTPYTP